MSIKKFISIKTIKDIEIKTDIGFIPVKNIMKTIRYEVYEIKFSNGVVLECADKHILIDEHDEEIYVDELLLTDRIKYDGELVNILSIENKNVKEHMYDIQMEYHHKYYTNGVLSHNTTVASGYICHAMTFTPEYTTAVLANKGSTSREILTRIKMMYEYLPWYLQMGVTEWNKGRIELGNKSKVISAPASTSSIRGNSINCVDINTIITVKNKKTNEIEKITISELEKKLVGTT